MRLWSVAPVGHRPVYYKRLTRISAVPVAQWLAPTRQPQNLGCSLRLSSRQDTPFILRIGLIIHLRLIEPELNILSRYYK